MSEIEKGESQPPRPEDSSDDVASEIAETMLGMAVVARQVKGPMPSPEVLEAYERVLPGMAHRLLRVVEKEQDHRHEVLSSVVDNEAYLGRWGQRFGFAIATILGVGAIGLVLAGHVWPGTAIGTVDLVALASVFVVGRRSVGAETERISSGGD